MQQEKKPPNQSNQEAVSTGSADSYGSYGSYGGYGGYGGYGDGSYGSQSNSRITPRRVITFLQRNIRTIFLAGVAGLLGSYYWLEITPPMYRATAKIEMSVRRPRIMKNNAAIIDEGSKGDEVINTRLARLQGRSARSRLAKGLGEWGIRDADQLPAIGMYRTRGSRIIRVTAQDADPKRAAAVANAMAKLAEQITAEENTAESEKAVAWLREKAETHKQILAEFDRKLGEQRVKNQVGAMEGRRDALTATTSDLGERISELEAERVMYIQNAAALRALKGTENAASRIPVDIPMAEEVTKAVSEWKQAQQDLHELMVKYRENHPKVLAAKQLAEVRAQSAREAVAGVADRIDSTVELLEGQIKKLQNESDLKHAALADIDQRIRTAIAMQSSMEREKNAADMTYQGLLARIEEARLSSDENTATVVLVEAASTPSRPYYPMPRQAYLKGIAMALLAGAALAFLFELLTDRIHTADDIEAGLGLNILGVVPEMPRRLRRGLGTACLKNRSLQMKEAFAGIRTVLCSPRHREESRVLIVTSAAPADGKTVTACNIAASYALSGIKTLVVDMDLRRPRVAEALDIDAEERSLAEILSNRNCTTKDFVQLPLAMKDCPDLHVIASHPSRSVHATDVLASPTLAAFIDWAATNYQQVVIDTPPLGLLSDAASLANHATGAVVVVRTGKNSKKVLGRTIHRFGDSGVPLVGCVINAVPVHKRSVASAHGYSYEDYHTQRGYKD